MDTEFCKPRSYKSLSSSETVSCVENTSVISQEQEFENTYIELVETFKSFFTESYSALF